MINAINRINIRNYLLLASLSTGVCLYFMETWQEALGVFVVLIATMVNQFLLINVVYGLVADKVDRNSKIKMRSYIIKALLKFFILFGGLWLGFLLMDKKVVIPFLNYVFLIFAICLCIRKDFDQNSLEKA